jgi:predicted ATP-grasp superfamily ATP-dependent carboligase
MKRVRATELRVPAVVLGAGANGLGVARSLAAERVPVWLLDTDGTRPEMFTRAAKSLVVRALHGQALVEDLEQLATTAFRGVHPVLFLTQEETVKTVSRHREHLARHYRFTLPAKEAVNMLQHKVGFQRLAEKYGAPIPPLVHIKSLLDLQALESLHFPVVVKPDARHAEYGHRFKKAYRMENIEEATGLLHRVLDVIPDVVVQEWIEGSDSEIYFCLQYLNGQARPLAAFTGRKIRSWPPQVGGTASCTAAPEVHDELSRLTTRFFQDAGVVGMASMEYKRDARSCKFRMVEPTIGRTDYQEEVSTLNGVNLPYVAYRSELGLPPQVATTKNRPVAWRVRSEDVKSAAAQNQRLAQGYPHRGRVADALYRWGDPVPFLVHGLQRVRSQLRSTTLKLIPGARLARNKS